jgi:hypothetical protein
MAKKLRIEASIHVNVQMIGISTAMKDYRLAQTLNKAIALDLHRLENLPVYQEKNQEISEHSFYRCGDELNRRTFDLVQNRNQGVSALSLTPQMDYLLIVHGKVRPSEIRQWVTDIRKGTGILLVQELDLIRIKGLEGLLTDIEMHLMDLTRKAKERSGLSWMTPNSPIT